MEIPLRTERTAKMLLVLGTLTLLLGAWLVPLRTGLNLLLNIYYLLTLGLGGICFVAIHYAGGAAWPTAIRRVPEAMTGVLPMAAIALVLLFVSYPNLYSWRGEELHSFKDFWLSWPFFLLRTSIYLTLWLVLTWAIVGQSRRQDVDRSFGRTRLNRRLSALFIAAFAVTFWLASFDWIMSLEAHWYSTLFGVYNFAGLFLSSLACITILAVWLSRLGPFRGTFTQAHLHDLGKLIFAFSTFWMYIWFCQYMLIWYANIPEETAYFVRRAQGTRLPLFITVMILNWAVPFLVLLPKKTKKSPLTMVQVSVVILVGRWLDLYLMIFPAFSQDRLWFGPWEVGISLGAAGLFLLAVCRSLRAAAPVPWGDPSLAESLTHSH